LESRGSYESRLEGLERLRKHDAKVEHCVLRAKNLTKTKGEKRAAPRISAKMVPEESAANLQEKVKERKRPLGRSHDPRPGRDVATIKRG